MKVVRYHEGGPPDVLSIDEVEKPPVGPDDVRVDIVAASINPTDAKRRASGTGPVPKTTGSDFAGTVDAIGENVTTFSIGDRVVGTGLHTTRFQQGSFAESVSAPVDIVSHLPDSVSFDMAAAGALVGVTAWRALIDHAGLRPTETCFIHGGTGGVGHVALQLGTVVGAKTVVSVGNNEAAGVAADLGATAVVRYDSDTLLDDSLEYAQNGYDVILDHMVHDYFEWDIDAAAFNGRIIHIGGQHAPVGSPRFGRGQNLRIHMMSMSNLATRSELPTTASVLDHVVDLIATGAVEPIIHQTFELGEAVDVHRMLMEESFVGKLVIHPN